MKIKTGVRKSNQERVYQYNGCTYGVIESGIAVTSEAGYYPFFEVMENDIEWDGKVEIDKWKFHSDKDKNGQ